MQIHVDPGYEEQGARGRYTILSKRCLVACRSDDPYMRQVGWFERASEIAWNPVSNKFTEDRRLTVSTWAGRGIEVMRQTCIRC